MTNHRMTLEEAWHYNCVQCFAPTNDSSEDEKDQFYSSLKTVVEQVPTHDVLVVMGDAKIGNENAGLERAMGKDGCGKMYKMESD